MLHESLWNICQTAPLNKNSNALVRSNKTDSHTATCVVIATATSTTTVLPITFRTVLRFQWNLHQKNRDEKIYKQNSHVRPFSISTVVKNAFLHFSKFWKFSKILSFLKCLSVTFESLKWIEISYPGYRSSLFYML